VDVDAHAGLGRHAAKLPNPRPGSADPSTGQAAGPSGTLRALSSPTIHHEVLPNGLTLLLREARLAPVASLQFWAGVGAADERPGEEGLAHFHEHMLFKGTTRRGVGEVAGEVEGAGGRINAYTSFDTTVYYATLPSEAIPVGIDVLSDALRHSRFDADEVRREREVVLEEIRRSEDSPVHVLGDAMFRELYHVHPYRRPILGPAENVGGFERDRVMAFFRRWYTPANLTVVAAGDFEAAELAARLRDVLCEGEGGEPRPARPMEPAQEGLRTRVLTRPFERVRLELAWRTCAFAHEDATLLELLSFILGDSESSRLVQRVKEGAGLVDRIDASSYTPLDPGLFSVHVEVDEERCLRAVEAVAAEVERLRREPVRREELERARTNYLATQHYERESVSGLASKHGSFHVLGGDWRSEERYFETIRGLRAEQLLEVAERYLDPEQLVAAVLWPEDSAPVSHEQIAGAIDRGVSRTVRALATPRRTEAPHAPAPRPEISHEIIPEIIHYELEGGTRLYVAPRPDVPVVAGRAAFRGGLLADRPETAGLSSFLASMWLRGTRSHSTADFARAVENLASDVDGFSGRSSLGLTFDTTCDALEPCLDLFAEVLLEPAFDPDEVERERRETLASIERRADRLGQRSFLLFGETLFERHPYRLPLAGHAESVARFDAEQLAAHHARLVRAGGLSLAVAGDVDPDALARGLSARLADLPAGPGDFELPDDEPTPSAPRSAEQSADRAQAHLVVGFRGLRVDDPDRPALDLITQLLAGQGGRLFLDLRDRRSLAYSVNAVNVEGLAPGFVAVYIATAPDKLDEARAGLLEHLQRLVDDVPSEEELLRAQRYLTGSFAIEQQRSSNHAAHMALDALYGLGADASLRYAESLRAVSGKDVLRVARRIVRLDAPVEALIR